MLNIENMSIDLNGFRLRNINLSISDGEYFVLLGRSGIGKTVFLETIAGRYKRVSGKIDLNGRELIDIPVESRNIGFVYQNYELFDHMRVYENIGFPLKIRRKKKNHIKSKVDRILIDLDIEYLKNRYPRELSGGEKQRVAIARALISSPEILLLDEPMSALDFGTKENTKALLKDIHREYNTTVIHVTHDIEEAIYIGDRIGIMRDGKIEEFSKDINKSEIKRELREKNRSA